MIQTASKPDARKSISNMQKEAELLLCCSRTHLDFATSERIEALLQQDIDWEYLIQIAHLHGVMPLLYWSLKNTCSSYVPQAQLAKLRNNFKINSYNNLILTQELIKLLRLFESHNIPVLPFKGPILAASVYRNLSLRRISDLDILVHLQDFQKVADLLLAQGYESNIDVPWECHFVRRDTLFNIDLHRDIVPKHLSYPISDNYWWEHLETFSLAGTTVPNLIPEASLLILCLNGTKESWQSLNRICDVAELIRAHPSMDWKQIMEKFTKLGCKRLISLGLLLAGELLAAPLPEEVWQWVKSDRVAKSLFIQVKEELFSESSQEIGEIEKTIFHIRTRERLQDKVYSFVGLMDHSGWLTPTEKDLNFLSLPRFLHWLYFFIRPIRVFREYGLSPLKNLVLRP
jgi:Uncharacterised nucleotidyltransferase